MSERWSISYKNLKTGKYERMYYYDLKSFVTARDKFLEDPDKTDVKELYEKWK